MTIRKGQVFRHRVAGGGGWGDPLERDPALVLADVRNEKISAASAERDYGVVLDIGTWTVDAPATAGLRERLRACRGWAEPPAVLREEPVIGEEPA
jgi:N-methylhydantoinase B